MTRRGFLLRVILTGTCLAAAPRARGQESRTSGTVTGTALGMAPRAASAPAALAGLELMLVPKSDALLESLERIKRQSRDSMTSYRAAIPEMRQIVDAFVRDLKGADLQVIPRATVDDAGRFALADVPSGHWILIGRRSVYVDRASKDTRKETGTYQAQPRLVGYERVMLWLQMVTVEPGAAQSVELTDRNVWFEGVEEKTAARDRLGITPSRRSRY